MGRINHRDVKIVPYVLVDGLNLRLHDLLLNHGQKLAQPVIVLSHAMDLIENFLIIRVQLLADLLLGLEPRLA